MKYATNTFSVFVRDQPPGTSRTNVGTVSVRNWLVFALGFAVLMGGAPAYAQKTAIGPGGKLCSEWMSASHEAKAPVAFWVLGFLSGANVWGKSTDFLEKIETTHTPSSKLFVWIDEFCRDNPNAPIYAGANALACDLAGFHGEAWCNLK